MTGHLRKLFTAALTFALLAAGASEARAAQSDAPQVDGGGSAPPEEPLRREDGGDKMLAACLQEPTRSCALAAALAVTAEERLAIMRVDALMAIAETFADIGQKDRAQESLTMAQKAARNIGISVGTERKLAEMADIWAMLGEDDKAIEIAKSVSDEIHTANALGRIARVQARQGRVEAAQSTLDEIGFPLLELNYAVEVTEIVARDDAVAFSDPGAVLEARLDEVKQDHLRGLGYTRLAMLHAERGNREKARTLRGRAEEILQGLTMASQEARLQAGLAQADLALGERKSYRGRMTRAVTLIERILGNFDQNRAVREVVAALAAGDQVDRAVELAARVEDLRDQTALLERLAERENAPRVVEALAGKILERLDDEEARAERDRARLVVATAFSRLGAVERAAEVIRNMEQRDTKARGLAVLARALEG